MLELCRLLYYLSACTLVSMPKEVRTSQSGVNAALTVCISYINLHICIEPVNVHHDNGRNDMHAAAGRPGSCRSSSASTPCSCTGARVVSS